MFASFSLPLLILAFVGAAVAVWFAGIQLSSTTDTLDEHFHLGQALGGLILLAIATNLPEIAITASGAIRGDLSLATGNILGGIALQTVVLVFLDVFGVRGDYPLSYQAASLVLVLEGILVGAILVVTIMASQLPESLIVARVAPGGALIAALWLVGLWLIGKARTDLPWQVRDDAAGKQKGATESAGKNAKDGGKGGSKDDKKPKQSTVRAVIVFLASAAVTLIAGVVLEESGNGIAGHIGISGVIFGSTILAAATSLPEVSTGLAAVRMGNYRLAFSDIFGGNAFLPVLFLLATLLSGKAVLPHAQATDIYLAGLGVLLTAVYLYGLIVRPTRRILRMGVDSFTVLALYILGIAGLIAVAHR